MFYEYFVSYSCINEDTGTPVFGNMNIALEDKEINNIEIIRELEKGITFEVPDAKAVVILFYNLLKVSKRCTIKK